MCARTEEDEFEKSVDKDLQDFEGLTGQIKIILKARCFNHSNHLSLLLLLLLLLRLSIEREGVPAT
jgi:hypothetical protein